MKVAYMYTGLQPGLGGGLGGLGTGLVGGGLGTTGLGLGQVKPGLGTGVLTGLMTGTSALGGTAFAACVGEVCCG